MGKLGSPSSPITIVPRSFPSGEKCKVARKGVMTAARAAPIRARKIEGEPSGKEQRGAARALAASKEGGKEKAE